MAFLKKGLAVTMALTMAVPGSLPVYGEESPAVQVEATTEENATVENSETEKPEVEENQEVQTEKTETEKEKTEKVSAEQPEEETKAENTAEKKNIQTAEVTELNGKGTAEEPYTINTAEELAFVAKKVNAGDSQYTTAYYKQTADIDLQGSADNQWTPIGQTGYPFKGNFDGAGYTIKNLYKVRTTTNSSKNHYFGLFGITDNPAVIKNVTIENVTLKGSQRVGGIVGESASGNQISNCTVKGDIKIDAWWYAGVIGGYGYMNKIENCTVSANPGSYIKGNGGSYIGGIWGYHGEGNQSITNCSVSGLAISGDDRLGGISGIVHYGNQISNCTVSDCTITANDVSDREEGTVGLIAGANLGNKENPSIVVNNNVLETTATEIDKEIKTHTGANTHEGIPLESSIVGTNVKFDEAGKVLSGNFEHIDEAVLAEGSVLEKNEDGSFVVKTEEEANAVVQAGDKYYNTLQEAIDAADKEATIQLLKDFKENVSVPEGKIITIDLNGKTLSCDKTLTVNGNLTVTDNSVVKEPSISEDYKTVTYDSGKIVNTNTGRGSDAVVVTVKGNGTFEQKAGTIESQKNYTIAGYDKAHLTIQGGYQVGPEGGPGTFGDCILDITGGVIVGTDNAAVAGNGSTDLTGETTINLSGGTLIGRIKSKGYIACGIYHPQNGVLNMTGGTIYADNGVGILMRAGKANVTGGTIIATGSGTGWVGDNKNAIGHDGIVYDIKADYPKYEEGDRAIVSGEVKVTVEDGKPIQIYADENQKKDGLLEVSGGTYNKPIENEYCAEGFVPKDNGDGTFGVKEAEIVQIGNVKYPSLEKAVEAAKSGDTLTLLEDADISTAENALVISTEKELTLDLSGHNIKAANTETGRIIVAGTLTLKDSQNSGKIYTETDYTGSATGYTLIEVTGKFIMESGSIYAVRDDAANKGQFAVSAKDNGIVQIDGGKIEAGWYAISTNGSNPGKSQIIVNGGELVSKADYCIYGAQSKNGESGSVEINGGTVYGAVGGIAMKSGKLTVKGGTITSKGQGNTGDWGDGTGGLDNAAINVDASYGDVEAFIEGGKIIAEGDAVVLKANTEHSAKLKVSGGEFSSPVPREYCAEDYNPVEIVDEEGKISYGVADEAQIQTTFLGGSLRMDYKNEDGTDDYTKTSLRFGYQVKVPEGAELVSWKWNYGIKEDALSQSLEGTKSIPQTDGSFISNLVLTNLPLKKYDAKVYTAISVTYKKDGKTYTVTDKTENRSVKDVAEAIVKSPNAPETEKKYAEGLLNAFGNQGWTGYY